MSLTLLIRNVKIYLAEKNEKNEKNKIRAVVPRDKDLNQSLET